MRPGPDRGADPISNARPDPDRGTDHFHFHFPDPISDRGIDPISDPISDPTPDAFEGPRLSSAHPLRLPHGERPPKWRSGLSKGSASHGTR